MALSMSGILKAEQSLEKGAIPAIDGGRWLPSRPRSDSHRSRSMLGRRVLEVAGVMMGGGVFYVILVATLGGAPPSKPLLLHKTVMARESEAEQPAAAPAALPELSSSQGGSPNAPQSAPADLESSFQDGTAYQAHKALPDAKLAAHPDPIVQEVAAVVQPHDASVEVEAFWGEPFGVGKLTVDLAEAEPPVWYPDQAIGLSAPQALYPAFGVRYAAGSGETKWQVGRYECWFLFRGREPLQIVLEADARYTAQTVPADNASRRESLIRTWWRNYRRPYSSVADDTTEFQVVRNYLVDMLGRRLGLSTTAGEASGTAPPFLAVMVESLFRSLFPLPRQPASPASRPGGSNASFLRSRLQGSLVFDFDRLLGLLFGTESVRIAFQTDETLEAGERTAPADQPLPPPVRLSAVQAVGDYHPQGVEPIAFRVPEECFYLRCRTLAEFLWLRDFDTSWGGSFNDLITTDAVDYQVRPRLERQLALSPDAEIRRELDRTISDMALVGTDVFFQDGTALGVVFRARDGGTLETLIRRQREKSRNAHPDVVEQQVPFDFGKVSFLSTPDNRVRSFYAIDGDYQLVTNSSYIARRFLETGQGKGSLGKLREFHHARAVMPQERGDAVFIYLSDPFFRLIVSPQFRIEMTRRVGAVRDCRLVYLARLAARAEGIENEGLDSLIASGLLPSDFLARPDGSRPILRDGEVFDSLRGAPGVFLPIPDVPVTAATSAEVASYQRFAASYRSKWRRMDPVAIGLRHAATGDGSRQRVIVDVRITPYARENYERLFAQLDAPDQLRLSPVPGDLIRVEGRLKSFGSYLPGLRAQKPRAFGAIRDFEAPYTLEDGEVRTVPLSPLALLGEDYQVYAGVVVDGDPWLRVSGDGHARPGDAVGYSHRESAFPALLAWRRTWGQGYAAWAHSREILERTTSQLHLEAAERPAQVRLCLGDVLASKLGPTVQAICYMHARRISARNVRQVEQMIEQLKIKPQDARRAVEGLVGGRLVCPLGGDFRLIGNDGDPRRWGSTAWRGDSVYVEKQVPQDYCHPFLRWLRGAQMELNLDRVTLSSHVEIEVAPSAASRRNEDDVTPLEPAGWPAGADERKIQGTWKVVEYRKGPERSVDIGVHLQFQGDQIIQIVEGVRKCRFRYRLDSNSDPKAFDFRTEGQAWKECGIYRLVGDKLLICYGDPGEGRPAEFAAGPGKSYRFAVLERMVSGEIAVPP